MASIKKDFIRIIDELPDNLTIDEYMYHIYLKTQIFKGKQQIQEGNGIPHEDIEAEIKKWLR